MGRRWYHHTSNVSAAQDKGCGAQCKWYTFGESGPSDRNLATISDCGFAAIVKGGVVLGAPRAELKLHNEWCALAQLEAKQLQSWRM